MKVNVEPLGIELIFKPFAKLAEVSTELLGQVAAEVEVQVIVLTVYPVGRASITVAFDTFDGPLLVTTIVYVSSSLTAVLTLSPIFLIDRSALGNCESAVGNGATKLALELETEEMSRSHFSQH